MLDKDTVDLLGGFRIFGHIGLDDFCDKLSFQYTCIILYVMSFVVIFKQYIMKPISCYLATDIGGVNLIEFMEGYCWVKGTIPITYKGKFPYNETEWNSLEKYKILYYQWTPFVLLMQCALCYVPQILWKLFTKKRNGIDLKKFMITANNSVYSSPADRKQTVKNLTLLLGNIFQQSQEYHTYKSSRWCNKLFKVCPFLIKSKRYGNNLAMSYIFTKLLYISNASSQIAFMHWFLNLKQLKNQIFGLEVLSNIYNGADGQLSQVFARVAYCCAPVKVIGATNYAVAQCVLPVNMMNEKFYVFLYFWMLMLIVITSVSMFIWFYQLFSRACKLSFVQKFLVLNNKVNKNSQLLDRKIARFIDVFLKHDGVFIMKMMSINVGDMITGEILGELWDVYKQNPTYNSLENMSCIWKASAPLQASTTKETSANGLYNKKTSNLAVNNGNSLNEKYRRQESC